ncbi:MAG TPA: Ada metal-binding domain-containing protein [Thermoanaerobaculia bacterium]|nr:Ada metal-binding domain-containing protein [Thermoanaerobaculia bacterium]
MNSAPEQQWRSVLQRDRRQDGRFYYAVRTTRIYCRPSCPSRRPLRTRVEFFGTPAEAEEAGYRPCLRCRPKETDAQIRLITETCRLIDRHLEETLALDDLAGAAGVSGFHLLRMFRRTLGVSPRQFIEQRRFDRLRDTLRSEPSVTDAIYAAGFSSPSRVYENARRFLGMTPDMYRRGGAGATIAYSATSTSLGFLVIASTAWGIFHVGLGASLPNLITELHNEFPRAGIRSGSAIAVAMSWPAALESVPSEIRLTAIRIQSRHAPVACRRAASW